MLRQDPDVILIGELRDAETAQVALQAAESGHLVFSTLHTMDAAETLSRLIEFFPPEKHHRSSPILAGVLRGVMSQRLLPRLGGGRIPAVEVMVNNARIAELIRERRTDEIPDAIADGEFFEMQTFSMALSASFSVATSIARRRRALRRIGTTSRSRSTTPRSCAHRVRRRSAALGTSCERPRGVRLPALRLAALVTRARGLA